MKVIALYREIKKTLADAGIQEADAEARLIVADGLGVSLGDVFLRADEETEYNPDQILQKRLAGMPLAYAMRIKYFMGMPFSVDESVLIPRQDTEILADEALRLIGKNGFKSVLDLCCGSGCIGIALQRLSGVRVLGADISGAAVRLANRNANQLGAAGFHAVASDLFEKITEPFDMIVCNPPYVTEQEYTTLERQVREFEPKAALVGGLLFYEKIAAQAAGYMRKNGALALEIGCSQKMDVEKILQKNGYTNIYGRKDLAGRDRILVCMTS